MTTTNSINWTRNGNEYTSDCKRFSIAKIRKTWILFDNSFEDGKGRNRDQGSLLAMQVKAEWLNENDPVPSNEDNARIEAELNGK